MSEEIFRKKSLDKIKSPENLNDYVRVSNPGVWLLLAAIIVLLAGACLWGIFGHIETSAEADLHVKNGEAFCYVADEDMDNIVEGLEIKCGDVTGTVAEIDRENNIVIADIELSDGHYDAVIIIESIKPVSFILN